MPTSQESKAVPNSIDPSLTVDPSITFAGLNGVTVSSLSGANYLSTPPITGIPEPSTWILFGTGLLGLFWMGRNKIGSQSVIG
ncbi:MAG: PEP-CTERM sorting domain-containing protein [Ferrovum sp.]|nr:PEP-CTERM sorting domain-containing protein [Ferrovum sp.]